MVLQISGLRRYFERGGTRFAAVDGVNLDVKEGDFVQIVGRSGSGKTTLLNLVTGLLMPHEGDIVLMGRHLAGQDDRKMSMMRNAWVGYIPQGNSLLDNFSILDNVRLPYYLSVGSRDDITGRADYLLNAVGIGHLREMYPSQLSGGEQRRAAIARALINSPKILVADEPTGDLDVASVRTIMALLHRIHAAGMTVLLVTHELDAVNFGRRVCLLRDGRLRELSSDRLNRENLVSELSCAGATP